MLSHAQLSYTPYVAHPIILFDDTKLVFRPLLPNERRAQQQSQIRQYAINPKPEHKKVQSPLSRPGFHRTSSHLRGMIPGSG